MKEFIFEAAMRWKKIVLLLALVILLVLYFWAHNIGDQPVILLNGFVGLTGTALDLLTVGAIVAVGGGLGRYAGRVLHLRTADLHPAEVVALEGGLGLGLLSIGTLLFGLIGLFNLSLWAALLVVALVLRRTVVGWLRSGRAVLASALRPRTRWERLIVVITGVLLAAALLFALAPPFAWDAMSYHLVGPWRYVQAGRITTQLDNHFLGFPQEVEILYGLALILFGRATAAAPLHLYWGLLALLAMAGLVRRYTDRASAYTSVLLLLSSYSLWRLFGVPYVDLAVMAYGALALVAITSWQQNRQSWLLLAGILAGLGLGVKYTAVGLVLALAVFIFLAQPRRVVRNGLIFGGAALVTFLPWMLKGVLLYQNPIYPYWLGGPAWDSLRTANFSAAGSGLLSSDLAWQWFILPLSASIFGNEDFSPYGFTLGIWLLTMPLVLLVGWRELPDRARELARSAVRLALPMLAFWLVLAAWSGIGAQPRLMLFGLPVAAVLGALAFHSLSHWPKRPLDVDFLMRAALIMTVGLGFFNVAHDAAQAEFGRYYIENDADGFLRNNLGNYYAAMRELDSLPAGSRVLFMWEPKSFYCPESIICIPDVLFDHWSWPLQRGAAEADTLMQQWREDGVDDLLVYGLDAGRNFGYDFWSRQHGSAWAENAQFPAKLAEYMELVWSDGFSYGLYRWRESS
ncbi:MAG: glycosyltransferase family 39 protein [Anaerolineae bacterium]|nr:glycosyltransferase family 39 protein [Anaerolineae bacterium]